MAGSIFEFFGYRAADSSRAAREAASTYYCPFIDDMCDKTLNDGSISGVCSIKPIKGPAVICCPNRMYMNNHRMLLEIANYAFGSHAGLVPGNQARVVAANNETAVIGVFGKRWGGELRLPKKSGHGNYFVDWILALVSKEGKLEEFVAVEVQTMDTTGNYRNGRDELLKGNRTDIKTSVGINWENVSKRILPQLIYKGQVLQREKSCRRGLFFVCPKPVLDRIHDRLGGALPSFPAERASITFVAYDYDNKPRLPDGVPIPLKIVDILPTSVEKLKEAFSTVTLSESNVYERAIEDALGGPSHS